MGDKTMRSYRRALAFSEMIKKDLVPILINSYENIDVFSAVIRLLVNLTIPVECLCTSEVLAKSEVHINTSIIHQHTKYTIHINTSNTQYTPTHQIHNIHQQIRYTSTHQIYTIHINTSNTQYTSTDQIHINTSNTQYTSPNT